MSFRRGDVVLVDFPHSDLRTSKRRPALIISRDNLQTGFDQVLVAMITSHLRGFDHPSRVPLPLNSLAGREAGVRVDSLIMTDNIATVLARGIVAKIGRVRDMPAVEAALLHTLAFPLPLSSK